MEFRIATIHDLAQLKVVYQEIIENMNCNKIEIWDEIYPCEFFEDDIKNNRLFVLVYNAEIISAFALCHSNSGEKAVEWKDKEGNALYIDRFGVHVRYSRKGIGSLMLAKAKEVARTQGADYLRLFVVDINKPAINLYIKNGFTKVEGMYDEIIDEELVLHEYGYEVEL